MLLKWMLHKLFHIEIPEIFPIFNMANSGFTMQQAKQTGNISIVTFFSKNKADILVWH